MFLGSVIETYGFVLSAGGAEELQGSIAAWPHSAGPHPRHEKDEMHGPLSDPPCTAQADAM